MATPRPLLLTALLLVSVMALTAACTSTASDAGNPTSSLDTATPAEPSPQPSAEPTRLAPQPTATPSSETVSTSIPRPIRCLPISPQVEINGITYVPLWGPMRSDIVRTAAFRETNLEAADKRACSGALPASIHEIAGVPIEQMFVEVRETKNNNGSNSSFPVACNFVNEVYTFTAVNAVESPPPFSRPTSEPWSEGSPTPTPSLPTNGPVVDLTAEGLLDAGWPYLELVAPDSRKVYWDSGMRVRYKGVEYRFSANHTLDDRQGRFQLPLEEVDQIDIILVKYIENRWPEGLARSLPHLLTDGRVGDHVRLLRLLDRPSEEVIIIDPCPTFPNNLQPDNVIFWGRVFPPQSN